MRKYKRFIARARMEALQVTQINKPPMLNGKHSDVVSKFANAWRRLIGTGDLAKDAIKAQITAKKPSRRVRAVLGR